jgi:RNA polymerase sigma-70 factor, ECF subfamily
VTDRAGTAMDETTDAEIIAASAVDGTSFRLLFDRHVDRIYTYIVRRVGPSLAEELTAETFARAFADRTRFVPLHESAGPWLYGIATNLIHNARRAERRRLAAYERVWARSPASSDDFDRADSRVDADRFAPRLIAALIRMGPGDRDALLLFAWQELTYDEIGVVLGIPAGTVGSRINRARRRLRASLGETGDNRMGAV